MAGTWVIALVLGLLCAAPFGCLGDNGVTEGSGFESTTEYSTDGTTTPSPGTTTFSLENSETTPSDENVETTSLKGDLPTTPATLENSETTPSDENVETTPLNGDLPTTPASENIVTTPPPEDGEATTTDSPHAATEQEDSTLLDEQTTESLTEEQTTAESTTQDPFSYSRKRLYVFHTAVLREVYVLNDFQRPPTIRSSQCGSRGRIIGGLLASVGEWPWAVVVKDKNDVHYCGGVLISPRHILTASHCIAHPDLANRFPLKVTVGDHDLSTTTEAISTTRWVDQALQHNQYNHGSTYNNDVGVLVVMDPLDTQGQVEPVCLPPPDFKLSAGTKLWVIGWGATMEGGPVVNVLRDVQVTVLNHSQCQAAYPNQYHSDRMYCVGDQAGGKDACQGDSGGPLLYKDASDRWFVVGVVSFGTGCGRAQYPGVYTSVPFHLDLVNWALNNA